MTEEIYYKASARMQEVKAFNGSILTHDDDVRWLGESDGYPELGAGFKKFDSPEQIRHDAHRWDGMPWYCRMKPGSLRIVKVTERRHFERIEEEVQ